jgi:hypothetical protein
MGKEYSAGIHGGLQRISRLLAVILLLVSFTVPDLIINETASAAQITNRSLTITSAQASASSNYTFSFIPATTTAIVSVKVLSCTTPLGSCTTPNGISVGTGTLSGVTNFGGAGSFSRDTTTSGCTSVTIWCMKRTGASTESLTAHSFVLNSVTNQDSTNCSSAANCSFFERITTYSDNYVTSIDSGTTASSTTQLFTVNAAIQEQLSFCVGATTVDDATTATPGCGASGSSINLGVLSSTNINVSPVPSGSPGGDGNNGFALLNTNASNGTTVTYTAVQQSGTNHAGTLRVAGATCNSGASNTDQCIDALGGTKATLAAGTEHFGMTVAGVNCALVTAYTCVFGGASTTYNLTRTTNYNCNGLTGTSTAYPSSENGVIAGPTGSGTGCSYAWDESGSPVTLASSTTPVGNEVLIFKFATTPNLVTPTGSYTAVVDYIATPVY